MEYSYTTRLCYYTKYSHVFRDVQWGNHPARFENDELCRDQMDLVLTRNKFVEDFDIINECTEVLQGHPLYPLIHKNEFNKAFFGGHSEVYCSSCEGERILVMSTSQTRHGSLDGRTAQESKELAIAAGWEPYDPMYTPNEDSFVMRVNLTDIFADRIKRHVDRSKRFMALMRCWKAYIEQVDTTDFADPFAFLETTESSKTSKFSNKIYLSTAITELLVDLYGSGIEGEVDVFHDEVDVPKEHFPVKTSMLAYTDCEMAEVVNKMRMVVTELAYNSETYDFEGVPYDTLYTIDHDSAASESHPLSGAQLAKRVIQLFIVLFSKLRKIHKECAKAYHDEFCASYNYRDPTRFGGQVAIPAWDVFLSEQETMATGLYERSLMYNAIREWRRVAAEEAHHPARKKARGEFDVDAD